jgi:hypothetical protein
MRPQSIDVGDLPACLTSGLWNFEQGQGLASAIAVMLVAPTPAGKLTGKASDVRLVWCLANLVKLRAQCEQRHTTRYQTRVSSVSLEYWQRSS